MDHADDAASKGRRRQRQRAGEDLPEAQCSGSAPRPLGQAAGREEDGTKATPSSGGRSKEKCIRHLNSLRHTGPPDPVIADHIAALKNKENRIHVADELRRPHAAVRAPRAASLTAVPLYSRYQSSPPEPPRTLSIAVSKEHVNRALRILDALVKALEAEGYPVTGEGVLIKEQRDRTPHVPTPAELEKRKLYGSRPPT